MFKTASVVACTCILAVFFVAGTSAKFGEDGALFVCREGKLGPSDKLTTKLKACNEPEAIKDIDVKCIAVCTTEAVGGLKDGIPDKDLFTNLVKTEFPEAEQADAMERLDKCFENRTFEKETLCADIATYSICGTKLVIDTKC